MASGSGEGEQGVRKRGRPPKVPGEEPTPKRNKRGREDEEGSGDWPPDPEDARLTVEGALCDAQSRLMLSSYTDFKKCFPNEPKPSKHADPDNPGLRQEELPGGSREVSLEGLTNWSDEKGAGWKTSRKAVPGKNKAESRWFGARAWGSWRMAFLMADLQRGVWAKAKEVPADPVEDAQPAAQGGEAADKVLSGEEEWHIFSPKQIDARRCLARTWNSGQGGQCEEARSGCSLCYKHQRMAVSTVGLSYGLVDGPIPEHRLAQFREAALRGVTSAPGRKRAERESEPPKPKRKKGKKMRKLKPKPKDAKLPKEKPKEKASKDKESKSEQPQRVRQPAGSQRAMKESKEEKRGRPKKSTSTPTEPVKEPEVRSRRFLQSMNEAELQKRNRQKWSSVDVAMDQALQQMDLESRGPFQGLTDKGTIPLPHVGKAVERMTTTSLEQRLQFTMVLRKSMHHNLQFGSAFVNAGGVTALRGWLQDALPAKQNGKEQLRKHEAVVLEALGLLQTLPVTLQTLRASGIGRTLMAIRNYCAPAMADAGELVNRWMKKFRTELMQTKAKAKPEASAAKPPAEVTVRPVVPPASALVRPAPMSTSSASSSAVRPVPVHPAQPLRVAVPARRPAFRTRMLTRKRDRERKAVNETEATLQQLFLLGKVLEDDDGVKTYDICDD